MSQDKIRAVAPQISLVAILCRRQQSRAAVIAAGEQGPVAIFAVFVWIAQEEFAQGGQVAVLGLIAGQFFRLIPVHLRLANAIFETKRFRVA